MTALRPVLPSNHIGAAESDSPLVDGVRQPPGPTAMARRVLRHPLTAICAVQTALSLTLVWSNTAFADEAYYLWVGRLDLAHWLHGASLPQARFDNNLSGSPVIYPPLGALASDIGGLAAARILSLAFMLCASVLLYFTVRRLFGRTEAIAATALWAVSEPALRLAFATYDPMSVLLMALSVWFVSLATQGRRTVRFVAAAAFSLALSDATAFSGIIMAPVVIVFAFLVWLPAMGGRRALATALALAGGWAAFFVLVMTSTRTWGGLTSTVLNRNLPDYQSTALIIKDVWKYSGIIIVLALVGAIIAVARNGFLNSMPVVFLGFVAFVVPAGQVYNQTGVSMDKHLAYGLWLGAMAAGYGVSALASKLAFKRRPGRNLIGIACALAMLYPLVDGWESAWSTYHQWANATSFTDALKPVLVHNRGLFFVPAVAGEEQHVAEYYTPQGNQWQRWDNPALALDPVAVPRGAWPSYYQIQLRRHRYGVIALFYESVIAASVPGHFMIAQPGAGAYDRLINAMQADYREPGILALSRVLEKDHRYRLVGVGPYSNGVSFSNYSFYGLYAIWQRVAK